MANWNWDKINEILNERFLEIFHHYCGSDYKGTPQLDKPAKIRCILLGEEDRVPSGAVYADHYYSFSCGKTLGAIQIVQNYENGDLSSATKRAFEILGEVIPTLDQSEDYQGYVPRKKQLQKQEPERVVIDDDEFTAEKTRRNFEFEKIPTTLKQWQIDDLLSRGLSMADIQRGKFKSVTQGDMVNGCEFPGITGGTIMSRSGYLVPLFDEKRRVVACQVKTQDKDAKYVIFGRANDAKYNFGEYPLTFLPTMNGQELYLTEGILKPFVCSALSPDHHWVGAISSNWINGINQLTRFVKNYGIKKIIICPDAGLMKNIFLANRYVSQAREIKAITGCEVVFGNWGQLFNKEEGLDPDEMLLDAKGKNISQPLKNIQELTLSEWEILLKQCSDDTPGNVELLSKNYQEMSALEVWKNTFKFTADFKVNSRFLDSSDAKLAPPNQREILAIKSGLGTGKTQLLKFFTDGEWKNEGIIALGPLNSLLKQTSWRCGWTHSWSNKGAGFLELKNPKGQIAMCIHSLHRGEITDYCGKYLVFDEVTQTLDCLLHDPSLSGIRFQLLDKLRWILRVSKGIVLLDGNLNDFVCNFFRELSKFSVRKVENTYGVQDRKVTVISGSLNLKSGKDYSIIVDGIVADLHNGLKPVIATDSQKECEAIDKILFDLGFKGLRIDSKTSGQDLIQKFLVDPDSFLLGVDVDDKKMRQLSLLDENNHVKNDVEIQYLIYSPTAQSGLSIACEYFDKFYGIFKGVLVASEIYQMLYRVRLTKDANRVVYCPQNLINRSYLYAESRANTVSNLSAIAFDEINSLSLFEVKEIKRIFAANLNSIECETSWYYQSRLDYESKHLRDCLIRLLESAGVEVELIASLGDKDTLSDIAETKEEIELAEAEKVKEIELISEHQYKELKANPTNNLDDQRRIKKYLMNQTLPGCVEHKDFDAEFIQWFDRNRSLIKAVKLAYQVERIDLFTDSRENYWYSNSRLLPWLYQNFSHKASVLTKLPIKALLEADEFSGQSKAVQDLIKSLTPSARFLLGIKEKAQPIAVVKSVMALLGYTLKQTKRSDERYYCVTKQLDPDHTYYSIVTKGIDTYMQRIINLSSVQTQEMRDGEVVLESLGQSLEPQVAHSVEPVFDVTDKLQFSYIQNSNLSVKPTNKSGSTASPMPTTSNYSVSLKRTEDYTEQEVLDDMWGMVYSSIADDCFPAIWDAVKAMGERYADMVYAEYPQLIKDVDPEWVLQSAF